MSSTFNYKNGDISYEIHGEGNSKGTYVLIHGFALDKRMWKKQVEKLTEDGYKVLTYDMRGFGESDPPKNEYSHSEDLKELMKELEIEHATICGHSFGGAVAIDFAKEYEDSIDNLVLLSPSLGVLADKEDRKETEEQMKKWAEYAKKGQADEIKSEILEHPSLASLEKEYFELAKEIVNDYSTWHFENKDPVKKLHKVINELPKIKCPITAIVGEDESERNREILSELLIKQSQEQEVDSELNILEGGHFLNMENEEGVNTILSNLHTAEGKEGEETEEYKSNYNFK